MVRVRVLSPLGQLLGLGQKTGSVLLEVPVGPDASLRDVFRHLAEEYPKFHGLAEAVPGDRLRTVHIAIDGRLVNEPDHSRVLVPDGAEVTLIMPYAGG